MKGVFGRLFGTEKAVSDLFDKDRGLLVRGGEWLGKLNYTEEEKAEADAQTREWGIRQLDAIHPFKVTQRIIAFAVFFVWAFMALNVVLAIWLAGMGVVDVREDMYAFATSDYIFWPALCVLGLFFTGGIIPERFRIPKGK